MRTKIVYILTSDDGDIYLEQLLVSAHSLKLYNPEAYIIVVMDKKTNSTIRGCRLNVLKYISEIKVVDVPYCYSKKECSRYLKTQLRKYIDGDYLFIDCDTIISDKIDSIDAFTGYIGAVLDLHSLLDINSKTSLKIKERASLIDWNLTGYITYYNSGVVFVKDDKRCYEFYEKWHAIWLESVSRGYHQDQISFNKANRDLGNIITELDGIWNCQIKYTGIKYFYDAKIVHYFSSNSKGNIPYYFSDVNLFLCIKNKCDIPSDIDYNIQNQKKILYTNSKLFSRENINFLSTYSCKLLRVIYDKYPIAFSIINKLNSVFFLLLLFVLKPFGKK